MKREQRVKVIFGTLQLLLYKWFDLCYTLNEIKYQTRADDYIISVNSIINRKTGCAIGFKIYY